jgi:hypothetical protein
MICLLSRTGEQNLPAVCGNPTALEFATIAQ